jgi:sterol desaturase/sphingolipid hydroxylase (fatty acid hydroxylase superfamily)
MTLILLGTAALLLAILEQVPRLRFQKSAIFRRYFASDIVYLLTGYVAGASLSLAYLIAGSTFVGNTFGLPRLATVDLPLWVSTPLALMALDLGQYVAHFLLHRYDALWEFHKIHHSSPVIDWLATFRSHFLEQVLRRIIGPLLLILVGFPINAALLAGGIFIAWAEFNHSNLKIDLRFLEPVFITPRLHKLHHVPGTLEKNLGTVFTFWDRLRGTFVCLDTKDSMVFGNGEPNYPQTWTMQFIEPFWRLTGRRKASYRAVPRESANS